MTARSGIDMRGALLNAALIVARDGLACVTLRGIASRLGVDHRTVIYHFGTIDQFRQAVAAEGLARDDQRVIARLIIDKHPAVDDLPGADRVRYLTAAAG